MLRIPVSLDVHLREAESVEGQPKKGVEGRLVDPKAMRLWLFRDKLWSVLVMGFCVHDLCFNSIARYPTVMRSLGRTSS